MTNALTTVTAISSDASTLFGTVAGVVVAMVGFYILIRIVKGIRK